MFASGFRSSFSVQVNKVQSKKFSTQPLKNNISLSYKEWGNPEKVINRTEDKFNNVQNNQVRVVMKAAPINTYDVAIIKGKYASNNKNFPIVGGTEGVGIVSETSANSKFQLGDWVIPTKPGTFGTWREQVVVNEKDLLKVPSSVPIEYASSLAVSPTTAYLLLKQFANLKEGEVIIQSGGNSMVGQTIAQLAAVKGIKTISIIRHREPREFGELVERMKYYGSHLVVTDDHLNTPHYRSLVEDLPAPSVAFDCVGGRTGTNLARTLKEGGTFVSYGSYDRYGLKLPTSSFIFNNIKVKGFWFQRWLNSSTEQERQAIIEELSDFVSEKKLRLWFESYTLDEYHFALPRLAEKRDRKIVLLF